MSGSLKVTQIKSTISHIARNRATIKALGLNGIGSTVEVVDNDATRGMVRQVRFLVTVEEIPGAVAGKSSQGRGDVEHANERTPARKRSRADVTSDASGISGDVEEKA